MPNYNGRPTILQFAGGLVLEMPSADPSLRVDLWANIFDGQYRLLLTPHLMRELEQKCGYVDHRGDYHPQGIMALYGQVAKGRYELDGKTVGFTVEGQTSVLTCHEVVRLALIGGGLAVVNGQTIKIDPQRAGQLVANYLVHGPAEAAWDLAYIILHTRMVGRAPSPEEERLGRGVAVVPQIDG